MLHADPRDGPPGSTARLSRHRTVCGTATANDDAAGTSVLKIKSYFMPSDENLDSTAKTPLPHLLAVI
jgi:hypothetical protein